MARARARYIVTGNMRSNGVDLLGQRLILMGECTWDGKTKNDAGKRFRQRELTSLRFKYEDQRWAKQMKVAQGEVVVDKQHLGMFLELVE